MASFSSAEIIWVTVPRPKRSQDACELERMALLHSFIPSSVTQLYNMGQKSYISTVPVSSFISPAIY